ncbi:ATP-binding protein [Effusibacillus consociatus]|uniref:ATP-binding protein n=1 Tax=Effusibacillus consociatus TaxID=1117041 RepID=UPI0036D3A880
MRTTVDDTLLIRADLTKLHQVLINIMKNGIETMPGGGLLQVSAYRKGDYAAIEISDTGVGMTKEEIKRLGNPFYSTKEKGTGLGLMVSYRIIQAMNGKIQVTSSKSGGTRFLIMIPTEQTSDSV